MTAFEYQGFNIGGFRPDQWQCPDLLLKAMSYAKAEGANLVCLDYSVSFSDDGHIVPFGSPQQIAMSTANIVNATKLAHQLGLQVFLKPHISFPNDGSNRNIYNTSDRTCWPAAWERTNSTAVRAMTRCREAAGPAGALKGAAFFIGSAAHDADDRIIYNAGLGKLMYDADGTGALAATRFASVGVGLSMTASDFRLV